MRTAMPNLVPADAARVFLAGATGVIGRRLVPLLAAAGHHVTAMTRRAARASRAGPTGGMGRRRVPLPAAAAPPAPAPPRRADRAVGLRALGADPVTADAHDPEGLRVALASARPDVVIHQLTDLADADL